MLKVVLNINDQCFILMKLNRVIPKKDIFMKKSLYLLASISSLFLAFGIFSQDQNNTKISYENCDVISYGGYGERSKVNGLPRTKRVNGYYKKNGTYVAPYYRSRIA